MLQQDVQETCAAWVKHITRSAHEEAEAVMMPLIKNAGAPLRYGLLLQGMYGFYKPMEALLQPFAHSMNLPGGPFQRTHLLVQDLDVLQIKPPINYCEHLPLIENNFHALGALYVLEGAALGGKVIARMLQAYPALPAGAFHFFQGKEGTAAHWKAFTAFMNSQAQTPEQMKQVGDAAAATFAAHTRWMKTL